MANCPSNCIGKSKGICTLGTAPRDEKNDNYANKSYTTHIILHNNISISEKKLTEIHF